VLDVDRTVINTTSWYRACVSPGLLLAEEGIAEFQRLNDRTYGASPDLDETEFRLRTLDLLNRAAPGGWSAARLHTAGLDIAWSLRLYPEVVSLLRHLRQQPTTSHRVLFLSAGHEPFIRGVVDGLLHRHFLTGLAYDVVGSTLEFIDGTCRLGHVMDGARKATVVGALLDNGDEVRLLADDNYHQHPMFDEVQRAGGSVLRVMHQAGASSNDSWRTFLDTFLPAANLAESLRRRATSYGLADVEAVLDDHAAHFRNLPPADNPIGVGVLSTPQFTDALSSLRIRLGSSGDGVRLERLLRAFVHVDGERVLLRGRMFYLGAPPYLFPGVDTSRERWTAAARHSLEALELLDRAGVFADWRKVRRGERWLVMCLLDHLKNLATHALDLLVRASLTDPDIQVDQWVEDMVEACHRAYWSAFLDRPDVDVNRWSRRWGHLCRTLARIPDPRFAIRELDDPYVIALSALSLIRQVESAGKWPVGLIDFLSGAAELGLAFRTLARLTRSERPVVGLAHAVYSSKNVLRGLEPPGEPTLEYLLARVPTFIRDRIAEWTTGSAPILLYDNNVTTFATLANVKRALTGHGRAPVHAAVACINYDNIAREFQGLRNEPLCQGWAEVLNYRAVTDYVTAFSTWGTSAKTEALHRMFTAPLVPPAVPALGSRSDGLLKICRVHNSVDLAAVVDAGANAIGIHAVSPPLEEYLRSQDRYQPLFTNVTGPSDLPLPHLEVPAIRAMLASRPVGLLVTMVLEYAPTPDDWARIRCLLDLPEDSSLQLQCRVSEEDVKLLRPEVGRGLICAIGADQSDFAAYFRFLDGLLDPRSDLILVDYSTHQPDLISGQAGTRRGATAQRRYLGALMRGNRVGILVADDVPAHTLVARGQELIASGVRITGYDTQNAVEVAKPAQRYRLVDGPANAQALIRKSPDLLVGWKALRVRAGQDWRKERAG